MKRFCIAALILGLAAGHGAAVRLAETPMAKVVTLLKKMKTTIEDDGKSEQASYDKFACWCEETLAEKAEDITKAKDKIEELQNNIVKNKGFLGSNGANLGQLKKDIAENLESQKTASAVRTKENKAYEAERVESEQTIGALEAAIKVMTGAGAGKKGFLETMHEAQLLSVVAGVRGVLRTNRARQSMSNTDFRAIQHFIESPDDFMKKSKTSNLQVGQNPFGDYAPQSTQIQGILKSMYDSFTGDLEKDNSEEGTKQKGYEELMATKKKELKTLEDTLESTTKSEAEKSKQLADDKAMRDDTKDSLEADEKFFAATKDNCKTKAEQWAQRSSLRSQELAGVAKAIEILNSDDAKKTFKEASTSLLQIDAKPKSVHDRGDAPARAASYKKLKSIATKFHSVSMARIAVSVKLGGHFDDVIAMIDKMVGLLREEAQEDIAHRDRCEGKQNANANSKEDAEHEISKAKDELERLEQALKDKKDEIKTIEESMAKTKKTMGEMTDQRNKETEAFKKAVKADEDSIKLLDEASRTLGKFYDANKLLQTSEVKAVAKPKPETNFDTEGGAYKGQAGGTRGVLAIIDMIKEDLQKEIKSASQAEVDAQTDYETDMSDLTDSYRAADKSKTKAESELAGLKGKKADVTEFKEANEKARDDEIALAKAIATDCDWVKAHFEKRAKARKEEINGLTEAKEFLAGVGTDGDLSLP